MILYNLRTSYIVRKNFKGEFSIPSIIETNIMKDKNTVVLEKKINVFFNCQN